MKQHISADQLNDFRKRLDVKRKAFHRSKSARNGSNHYATYRERNWGHILFTLTSTMVGLGVISAQDFSPIIIFSLYIRKYYICIKFDFNCFQ